MGVNVMNDFDNVSTNDFDNGSNNDFGIDFIDVNTKLKDIYLEYFCNSNEYYSTVDNNYILNNDMKVFSWEDEVIDILDLENTNLESFKGIFNIYNLAYNELESKQNSKNINYSIFFNIKLYEIIRTLNLLDINYVDIYQGIRETLLPDFMSLFSNISNKSYDYTLFLVYKDRYIIDSSFISIYNAVKDDTKIDLFNKNVLFKIPKFTKYYGYKQDKEIVDKYLSNVNYK